MDTVKSTITANTLSQTPKPLLDEKLVALARKYQLKLAERDGQLLITQSFDLRKLDNWAALITLAGTVIMLYLAWMDVDSILGYLFLLLLFAFVVLLSAAIVKPFTDYVVVADNDLTMSNSFSKEHVTFDPSTKITLEKTREAMKRRSRVIKYYWLYEIYLQSQGREVRLFEFSAETKEEHEANQVAGKIMRLIRERIRVGLLTA